MPSCKLCQESFIIHQQDMDYYEKVGCPPPTECPSCRERARAAFCNERNYYPYECNRCHKAGITIFQPGKIPHLFCQKCFWSDNWDAKKTGRDFDFTKTFAENLALLIRETPRIAMINDHGLTSENCEYTYQVYFAKNCYLVDISWKIEDCLYSSKLSHVKDSIDVYFVKYSQWLYECISCNNCHTSQYCMECNNCADCFFGYALTGCQNCLFCTNLKNKQYCIRNVQYSQEEYFQQLSKTHLGSWDSIQKLKKLFYELIKTTTKKYADLLNCENCTGDHLRNSKDCSECFMVHNLKYSKYFHNGDVAEYCYDCDATGEAEWCFNNVMADHSYMVGFSYFCCESKFCLYCDNCMGCHDCFGCVSLRKGEYCILNKQYAPKEYHIMKKRIIEHMKQTGEWGRYFHPSLCPYGYNETRAMEWHPLKKDDALKLGYNWQDILPGTLGGETMKITELPDDIIDFDTGNIHLIEGVYACERCQRNFKFIPEELNFYIKQNIPIPHLCSHCRHQDRIRLINPAHLREQECDGILQNGEKCHNFFMTTHPDILGQQILCESCYQNLVIDIKTART